MKKHFNNIKQFFIELGEILFMEADVEMVREFHLFSFKSYWNDTKNANIIPRILGALLFIMLKPILKYKVNKYKRLYPEELI